jgi:hypothetical protein
MYMKMTDEVKEVHRAAGCFNEFQDEESLGALLTACMDLPIDQWPPCEFLSRKFVTSIDASHTRAAMVQEITGEE